MVIGFFYSFFTSSPVHAAELQGIPQRIDGKDRFEVAENVSKNWSQAEYAIVTNYLAFADALTSAPLAYKYNAPILLTRPDSLTASTQKELERLAVKKVFVIGGSGSITNGVIQSLRGNGKREVERIGGKDRFEVSANIARKLGVMGSAIVANGFVFPDALAVGPFASEKGIPILLTGNNVMPPITSSLLKQYPITKTWVVGGEGSVSKAIFDHLPSPSRIGGKDRYEVAANVAKRFGSNNSRYFLATGLSFADALTGSILAAKQKGNILLTSDKSLPEMTSFLLRQDNRPVTILGGTGSIGDKIVSDILSFHSSDRPVLYFVPHQDDEILSLGIDIRNELSRGRKVHIVLMTDGENSEARDLLNGEYDRESKFASLAGVKIKCGLHNVYHDARLEGFQFNHLSFEQFSNLRTNEFQRALAALGVPKEDIHIESLHSANINKEGVEEIVKKYIAQYPNADVRSLSWFDGHPTHSLIGQTIQSMEKSGVIQRYQVKFYLSIFTDRFYSIQNPMEVQKVVLENDKDTTLLLNAANEYKKYDPRNGFYAIGYHSVSSQFEALINNPYEHFHY